MNLNGRLKKLETQIGTPRKHLAPTEALGKIEAIISRAFDAMPPRLKEHARRIFRLGEEKTQEETRVMLNNITLARKLRGGKA